VTANFTATKPQSEAWSAEYYPIPNQRLQWQYLGKPVGFLRGLSQFDIQVLEEFGRSGGMTYKTPQPND
jgi:hypothetical protein